MPNRTLLLFADWSRFADRRIEVEQDRQTFQIGAIVAADHGAHRGEPRITQLVPEGMAGHRPRHGRQALHLCAHEFVEFLERQALLGFRGLGCSLCWFRRFFGVCGWCIAVELDCRWFGDVDSGRQWLAGRGLGLWCRRSGVGLS